MNALHAKRWMTGSCAPKIAAICVRVGYVGSCSSLRFDTWDGRIGSLQAEGLFTHPGEAPNGKEAPLPGECCSDWQATAHHKVESNTHLRTLMSGEQL